MKFLNYDYGTLDLAPVVLLQARAAGVNPIVFARKVYFKMGFRQVYFQVGVVTGSQGQGEVEKAFLASGKGSSS